MKTRLERMLALLTVITSSFIGCNCNPVGPGNYKDATKFTWTVDTLADPRNYQTMMSSFWGTSASNLYVCGHTSDDISMMYRYDGKSWTKVPISILEGGPIIGAIDLQSMLGFASNDIWAVGSLIYVDQSTGNSIDSLLAIHWDGKAWSKSSLEGGGNLVHIVGLASNDIWASGTGGVFHYDGSSWKSVQIPNTLYDVKLWNTTEVAPNDVYTVACLNAVTPTGDTASYYLYHFDGTSWHVMDSVIITSSYVGPMNFGAGLFSIEGVLYSIGGKGVEVLDGDTWTAVLNDTRIGMVGGNNLNNLFAIGGQGTAYWYNGKQWTQLDIPGSAGIGLSAVWTDGSQVFIAGFDAGGHKSYVFHGK